MSGSLHYEKVLFSSAEEAQADCDERNEARKKLEYVKECEEAI